MNIRPFSASALGAVRQELNQPTESQMLRIILERHELDQHSGMERNDVYTLDLDIPELEAALTRGGRGDSGFEVHRLIGVDVLPNVKHNRRCAEENHEEHY